MASISEVKTNLLGRSKQNRFRITLPTPDGVVQEVMIKASKMPGRSFESKTISYRGAQIKYAGEPVYTDWSVTVYGEDYTEYERFNKWMQRIGEVSINGRGTPADYKISSVKVDQIGLDNEVIATMFLNGVFPISIGDVTYDNETSEMVTFEVTFNIDETLFEKAS